MEPRNQSKRRPVQRSGTRKNTCITDKTGRSRKERKAFSRGSLKIPVAMPTAKEPFEKTGKVNNLPKLKAIKLRLHLEAQNQQGSVRYRQVISHLNRL